MIEVLLIFALLLFLAWAAHTYIPHPIGLILAVIVVVVAALYLIGDIDSLEDADAAVRLL